MGMSHFGVLSAPMVTQFALMLIGLLFMHCMDGLLIFHEGGVGTRLLNWGQGLPVAG